ncbi:MAG TPA: hypothetical protein VGN97_12995 [Mesorhizobium sp.]|jgi:hypothetical protein|nr:hypothetical protein [Mesorhizobium sp.]
MEGLLTAIAVLFAFFLVMSAAVEMILESFRGFLESVGLTWLKSKVSLDDALKISSEFVPTNSLAAAKISALIGVAEQTKKIGPDRIEALKRLRDDLVGAGLNVPAKVLDELNRHVSSLRETLSTSESNRIFVIRLLAAVIGVSLAALANLDAVNLALTTANLRLPGGYEVPREIGWFITGLAAASGSSYWHDQLDRVRSLKSAYTQAAKLASKVN